jgi:hypothetical protein
LLDRLLHLFQGAEVELAVGRLADPALRDVAAGRPVEIGPEIDEPRAWAEYRRRTPAGDDSCRRRLPVWRAARDPLRRRVDSDSPWPVSQRGQC